MLQQKQAYIKYALNLHDCVQVFWQISILTSYVTWVSKMTPTVGLMDISSQLWISHIKFSYLKL